MKLAQKCLMGLASLCLLSQPLFGEEKAHTPQLMTETELLKQLDEKDQGTYGSLSPEGKALVLKMASLTNDPVMQKCKQVMGVIQNMRDMMEQFETKMHDLQKKPDSN